MSSDLLDMISYFVTAVDEDHVLFRCSMIDRRDLDGLPPTVSAIWQHDCMRV